MMLLLAECMDSPTIWILYQIPTILGDHLHNFQLTYKSKPPVFHPLTDNMVKTRLSFITYFLMYHIEFIKMNDVSDNVEPTFILYSTRPVPVLQ